MILWHNLFRYPRFFFSSIIGLFLIILNPVITLIKQSQKREWNSFYNLILIILFLCALSILIFILQQMFLFE